MISLPCSCRCHELRIEKDSEIDYWYVSIWLRGYQPNSLSYRLKCIWHIIRYGRPYGDEVVLELKSLVELQHYVGNQINHSVLMKELDQARLESSSHKV